MQVFIGGIMQGSRLDQSIASQDYRGMIAEAVLAHHPEAEILDPNELHPNGTDYDAETARATLFDLLELAAAADATVAFLPQASMGTALEMWRAHDANRPVITISPMTSNWVVRFLSDVVLPDLQAFEAWMAQGGLQALLRRRQFDKPATLD
jgi:hypothetical protein